MTYFDDLSDSDLGFIDVTFAGYGPNDEWIVTTRHGARQTIPDASGQDELVRSGSRLRIWHTGIPDGSGWLPPASGLYGIALEGAQPFFYFREPETRLDRADFADPDS